MKSIHPMALFRLSVLGPLASRDRLEKGELTRLVLDLASKTYDIPGTKRVHVSPATIERWFYAWKEGGIDALAPKARIDRGRSQLASDIQEALIAAKKENPSRSITTLIRLLELKGTVGKGALARSSVHRFLKAQNLSQRILPTPDKIERRRFVAEHAGDIWQGDVLHGPRILIQGKYRKTYLVSFMDDASRLITHSEFRLGETALDIQAVLRQAILKRGLPKRIILDNGSAYRCGSLQGICARLKIRLVYCRPYEPQGKGKLEKWHATFRAHFLNELDLKAIEGLADLNSRLWAYLEHLYHTTPHQGLEDKITPISRWRQDIIHIKNLGVLASQLDEIFYHRHKRLVRKDGCVSLNNKLYEVPYTLSGENVILVFDPEGNQAKWVESLTGERLGDAVLLDAEHNTHRKRQRPPPANEGELIQETTQGNLIELNYEDYQKTLAIHTKKGK